MNNIFKFGIGLMNSLNIELFMIKKRMKRYWVVEISMCDIIVRNRNSQVVSRLI